MKNKRIGFLVGILLISLLSVNFVSALSCNYWKNLTITNNDADILRAGYTGTLTFDTASLITAGKLNANCDNLFLDYDGTLLDINVLDCDTASSKIEFKLQENISISGNDNKYSILYDCDTANTNTDLTGIYYYYNDFESETIGQLPLDFNFSVPNSYIFPYSIYEACNDITGKGLCANLSDRYWGKPTGESYVYYNATKPASPLEFSVSMKWILDEAGSTSFGIYAFGVQDYINGGNSSLVYMGNSLSSNNSINGLYLYYENVTNYTLFPRNYAYNFNEYYEQTLWINQTTLFINDSAINNYNGNYLDNPIVYNGNWEDFYFAIFGEESAGSTSAYMFDNYTIKLSANTLPTFGFSAEQPSSFFNNAPIITSMAIMTSINNSTCKAYVNDSDGDIMSVNFSFYIDDVYENSAIITGINSGQYAFFSIFSLSVGGNVTCYAFVNDGNDTSAVSIISKIVEAEPITPPTPSQAQYITCPENNFICEVMKSSGAGLGLVLQYIGIPLAFLLIALVIVGVIVIVASGIGKVIGERAG